MDNLIIPSGCSRAQALEWAYQRLKLTIPYNTRLEVRLLLAAALKITIEELILFPQGELFLEQIQIFQLLIERREKYEPISRILGEREFWSLPFYITSATLDPRPDSETLVEAVLKDYCDTQKPLTILDLGTGSGCLILTLLKELPNAVGVGIDISLAALKVAQENGTRLKLSEKVVWIQGDWAHPVVGPFDIIISNPPYISTQDFEQLAPDVQLYDPYHALVGGKEGLECYRTIISQIKILCYKETKIYLEIGKDQHQSIDLLMQTNGFRSGVWHYDLSGIQRCGMFMIA